MADRLRPRPGGAAAEPQAAAQLRYAWQRLSADGAADDDTDRYENSRRDDAVGMLSFEPHFALDVGCYSGGAARSIKDAFPQCRLWGVEPDAKAAELARRRMDKVIVATFDTIDWAAQGLRAGDIDTVFLLDVLEHMYNPWRALESLRELVSPRAQLVISLPNVRNLFLLRDLMNGYWRYRDAGLLDSTHIRFFTEHEALRLIYQTGFRVERHEFTINAETASMYEQWRDRPFPWRVEFERGSLLIENQAEVRGFLAAQHLFLARPALKRELGAEELRLIEGPHPETFALGFDRPGTL
ncbi:MAG: class I SAM-dependent methyltransferase [Betaproteobacteria bacterium]|nr:class I SAM-dependent methyltransferase [Betaproteobacteria bacterium]